jgi:hypothetical protein
MALSISGHRRKSSAASKRFDAVAWMRKRREEIDREDEGLTWEERTRKTLKLLEGDPLWERLKARMVSPHPRRPSPPRKSR